MTDTITYKAIRERIKQEAKEIIEQYAEFPTENTCDSWEDYTDKLEKLRDEESHDLAYESVDSWDWSIYTYKGFQVYDALNGQERQDAESMFEDVGGYETAADQKMGPYEMGAAMAFWWLVQELHEEIENRCEELIELANDQMGNL